MYTGTSVTLTGTGTPIPAANRAGAGTLVTHKGHHLQFDAGRGTVLRLADLNVPVSELNALFLTHHHSDHLMGVPDLLITRWVQGARDELPVVAPAGPLDNFGANVLDLWEDDEEIRKEHTGRPSIPRPQWISYTSSNQIQKVWENDFLQVEAVEVQHEPVTPAVAYRVTTDSKQRIVISGDTRVCDEVAELAQGADVLVHEAVLPSLVKNGREYVAKYHAECHALGRMAAESGVQSLLLTHLEPSPCTYEEELAFDVEVRRGGYTGSLYVGRDLTRISLGGVV